MSGAEANPTQPSQATTAATKPSTPPTPAQLNGSPLGDESSGEPMETTATPTLERQPTGGDLSDQQRARAAIFEGSKDLQELCRDNGLSASQFAKKGHTVTTLDTFLGFWSTMKSVMHFPALRELSIVKHPTIVAMEGLESCPNLEKLTISECGLEKIECLSKCVKLTKLNLSSNRIRSMEPLRGLDQLEELWLNDNRIERLEGLWGAKKLTVLWICCNRIERIESALNGCVALTELNMAGNRICSFKTLLSLANLDQLAVLTLSDPHFGDNPVCRLCNYQTYLMCQLTRLTWLDTFELSTRNKQIAEATMLKKKMYYNMRIKCIKRDVQQRLRRANDVRRHTEVHIENNIAALMKYKKEIEQILDETAEGTRATEGADVHVAKEKLTEIESCLRGKCLTISRMNLDYETLASRLQWTADVNISRLMLELETGGNIRLEDGTPGDAWYASCVDLVKSRLFASELRPFGISDLQITRVTRINNRYLRNRFHARMEEILVVNDDPVKANVSKKGVTVPAKNDDSDDECEDDSDTSNAQTAEPSIEQAAPPGSVPESSLEYLFYMQPPVMEQIRKAEPDQFYAAEYGFREPAEYRKMGLEGAIKLSNSVALVEMSRLLAAFASKGVGMQRRELSAQSIARYSTLSVHEQGKELRNEFTREMRDAAKLVAEGEWEIPRGVLLVVKVFPGYTKLVGETDSLPSPIDGTNHPGLHSLQVQKASTPVPPDAAKQKMYYLFDKTLVLPEYLVEYEYVTAMSSTKGLVATSNQSEAVSAKADEPAPGSSMDTALGEVVKLADEFERRYRIRRPPSPPADERPATGEVSTPVLDDAVLQILGNCATTGSHEVMLPLTRIRLLETGKIRNLNLLACNLEAMPDLSSTKDHLETLVLSYNQLVSIDASVRVLTRLKHLDVSSNRLMKLEHLDVLENLVALEASHNQVSSFEDIACLSSLKLKRLNLRKNPICETKRYRLHILRTGPSQLEMLDEQPIARDEFVAAQQLLTTLSSELLLSQYRSTQFEATAQSSGTRDRVAWSAVEELHLHRELITVIHGFEPFVNLRTISFADNAIKKIDGLQCCARLEELNLEDNEITKIENLASFAFLKRLNLARNRLTAIDELDSLASLTQLSLEDNMITSLRGLSALMKLMELYIGSNRIDNLKEVQHLKTLPKLTILDLTGNELTRVPDYRLYSVYYLRRLKVLDGLSVSPQDQSDAKQKYSGKLTLEFIVEKCGNNSLERLAQLDLSSCRIRELGSISGKTFPALRELNLENNQINDISGLEALAKLRILNLNRNRLERLTVHHGITDMAASPSNGRGIQSCAKLEQLYLAYNHINDMAALGLHYLDSLKVLHLQGNAMVFFAGLDTNTELLELRLDKNKIRQLDPHSTTALRRLRVLSLDDNGLRTLSHFNELLSVEFLDLSNNRITELDELDKLGAMPSLLELRLLNNPVTKKHLYRHSVLFKLNTVRSLDAREVTAEERDRAEALFLHERNASAASTGTQITIASSNGTQFSMTPSTIPGKHSSAAAANASNIMIMTSNGARSVAQQLASGDALAGSLLRKNPITPAGFSPNQQPVQSVSTFPKPDQPTDASIAIAPSSTTTKSLLGGNNGYRSYSVSNHSATSALLTSPSPTVTVAAAFNASLSNTGSDQLNLGTLRYDRRRMNSVHYDPAVTGYFAQGTTGAVGMPTGAASLASSVITTNSILRAPPMNVPTPHTMLIHPLSADIAPSSTKASSSTSQPGTTVDPSRSFSGYVVAFGNQKRYGSLQDRTSAADLAAALATAAKSGAAGSGRPR